MIGPDSDLKDIIVIGTKVWVCMLVVIGIMVGALYLYEWLAAHYPTWVSWIYGAVCLWIFMIGMVYGEYKRAERL